MADSSKILNVAIIGPLGATDSGADAALVSTVADIRYVLGDRLGRLIVITDAPDRADWLVSPYGDATFVRYSRTLLLNPRIWLNNPDIVVFVGDELLTDRPHTLDLLTLSSLTITLRMMGARLVFYANQVEGLSPANRSLTVSILMRADLIMLASPEAVVQLKRHGVSTEIFCTASPVCNFPLPPKETVNDMEQRFHLNTHKRPVVTIAPREFFWWHEESLLDIPIRGASVAAQARESSARFCRQMAIFADWVSETHNGNIVLLAVCKEDEPVIQAIYESMQQRYRARLVHGRKLHPSSVAGLLALSAFQVTGRVASIQLAAKNGVPSIVLKGGEQLEALQRQLGMIEYLIDYATFPNRVPNTYKLDEQLIELATRILEAGEALREQTRKGGESLHNRARGNRAYLREWIERVYFEGRSVLERKAIKVG
jgi:hypothetical protein